MPDRLTTPFSTKDVSDDRLATAVLARDQPGGPIGPGGVTSIDKLTAFLSARVSERWKVTVVTCLETLVLAVDEVQHNGSAMVRVDPTGDSSEGDSTCFVDLMELHKGVPVSPPV